MNKNVKSVYDNPEENGMFWAMTQCVYGNKTMMCLKKDRLDSYLLGCVGGEIPEYSKGKIDRTIVKLPGTDNLVLIYNKLEEESTIKSNKEWDAKDKKMGRELHKHPAMVTIPEIGLELYSRAIICRVDENGEFCSLQNGDSKYFSDYLYDCYEERCKRNTTDMSEQSEVQQEEKLLTLNDLQTKDFVVLRNGQVGIVFAEDEYFVYQSGGGDYFDVFNKDLTDADGNSQFDIVKVYRCSDGVANFINYMEEELIFNRK